MRKFALGASVTVAGLAVTGIAVGQIVTGVPTPQAASGSPANIIANGYSLTPVATGAEPLENPKFQWTSYGILNDAAKTLTEPDENTYLVTPDNPGGPTAGYDYGRHFLVQGHENGSSRAYLTRINLDVHDPAHRITMLNDPVDANTTGITSVDGSTFDPYTGQLLFTQETSSGGGVVATPLKWTSTSTPALTKLDGSIGNGAYEGVVNDKLGNIYLVEDAGGANVTDNAVNPPAATNVKQPNSFVYRFVPTNPADLTAGKLQALQVSVDGTPITFHTGAGARDDALGEPIRRLHSGETLQAKWVTIHDTATSTAPYDANAAAKAAGATPLKRPENGKFVPGSDFQSFVFSETGDTDVRGGSYPGAADRGAWGAFVRIDMPSAGADTATVKTILLGDQTHNSFDNIVFLDKNTFLAAEDRGDTLHQQLNTLDSVWSFDLTKSYSDINADGKRLIALGRDPVATTRGNNEPTGIYVSDGSTAISGILGTTDPATQSGVHAFVTQQHGMNTTYEITPANTNPFATSTGGRASGTVPATLALTLGTPATFGAFTPGVAKDYTASTTASVVSTAGDATLSVADPSTTATGHLVNGTFSLPTALQAKAASPAGTGSALTDVGGSSAPTTLLTYPGPVSNDPVALTFQQHIGSADALRTGTYAKTLTFTLSTTTP